MNLLNSRLIGVAILVAFGVVHVAYMADFAMWLLDLGRSREYVVARLIPRVLPPIAALLVVFSMNRNRTTTV